VPTVLAFEPDPKQAGALKLVVRDRVGAEFVHVESKDAALEAIRARVPDLILLTALLSPRDETEIADLLRELDGADYVQTLTIPLLDLGTARPAKRKKRGLLSALTGGDDAPAAPAGCDPAVFADEIANYLQQAEQARADAALARRTKKPTRRKKKDAAEPSAQAEPQGGSSSYWSWDTVTPGAAPAEAEPVAEVIAEPPPQPDSMPLSGDGISAFAEATADRRSRGAGRSAPRERGEEETVSPVEQKPAPSAGGSSWANPWDVSEPSPVKPGLQAETYLDDLIIPEAAAEPTFEESTNTLDALLAQPAPTTAADALVNGGRAGTTDGVRAGLQPPPPGPIVISDFVEALEKPVEPVASPEPSPALAAFEADASDSGTVRAGLQSRPPEPPAIDVPEDDDAVSKRPRRHQVDDFEPDFVPAKLPTRAESGALLALQADLARLRQQRESTGTVLGTAKAAQERAARAAAEAVERARREADIRAEQAAARVREEALAERRAREAAEQRAREEAERRAEVERKAQERAERLAREAAEKAREEAARQARVEHERRLDEERRAREEAERRAAAEREAREQAERRAKEEAARLEREARERQAHAEAERKAREAAEAHAAAERKAREEAERRAKEEAARIAREAERKAKADAERLAREAEQRARAEAERIAREAEVRAREDAARFAQEAERRAQEKADRAAREAERKAHEEAERLARVKAAEIAREKEARAKEEARAERLARQEAEKRAEAERRARLELERRTEAERKAREDAERLAREQAQRDAEAARAAAPPKKTAKKKKAAAKPGKKDSKPRAIQDEWGLYDPNAAGFEALFAKLEAIENGEEERVPAERPRAPKPLAMWAVQAEPPVDLLPPRRPPDEFRALVSQFSIPHAVAAVSYASGAKIGKVRVTAAPRPKARHHDEKKVVILSRKLLKAARREAAAEQRQA
jgi:hypothetical protein